MMVSARKVKARLDKNKLAELKKKNVDKQEEMGISAEEARQFSDDLVKSAISGFEKELQKSSPAMKMLAANLSGMIQEFFIGFKQGVDAELNTFVKDTGKAVTKATGDMSVAVVEKVPEILKEPIEDLKQEQQEAKKEKEKVTREQKTEMIISDVLKRPTEAQGAAKTVLGKKGGVKDWLTRVGLGSIGMEETAEKIVAQRQQKEAFIQTESKLRAKEFEGKDPKEVRKILEENFKVISETTEKLREVEKEISAYKELGYSEEQAKQLGVGVEKQALTEKLVAADPSRLGMYKEIPVQEKLEKKESSSVLEETIVEQQKQNEEAAKKQDQQTTLLSEIRDILKSQGGAGTSGAAQAEGSGLGLPDLPRFRLPKLGGIAKGIARGASTVARGAGNLLRGGVQIANAPLSGVAKVAAPLAAGLAVGEGVMDLAEGKKVEEIGQVVPEGWSKLNPFSWAMRGGMYAGEKLNKGYGAVSEKLGGSGSLGGDIFEGVQKVKGFFSGAPTIEDVKKSTSDLADKGMNAVFGTKAERVARQTDRAMLEAPDALADAVGLKDLADETKRDKYIEKWKKDGGYNKLSEKEKVDFDKMVTEDFSLENSKKKLEELEKSKLDISQSQSKGNNALGFVQSIQNTKNLSEEDKKKALGSLEAQYTGLEFGDVKDAVKRMVTPGAGGVFSGITTKAKSLFGMGTPTVEGANVTSAPPHDALPPVKNIPKDRTALSESFKSYAPPTHPDGRLLTPQEISAAKESIRVKETSIAKENGVPKSIPQSVKEATPDASAQQTAAAIGKNIVVQAPAPVVIPQGAGGGQQVVSQPFTNNIRNNEPSISDYLRSRYTY